MNKLLYKNVIVIVIGVIAIILGAVGITYALSTISSSVNVSASNLNVIYTGSNTINVSDLSPRVTPPTVNITTNVARVEFTVKGASSNINNNVIYDIMLNDINADSVFFSEYTRWRLYKNNSLLSEGTFDYSFDTSLQNNKLTLTNIQQDMPSYNGTADSYVFLMWIEESCTDVLNCSGAINQNNLIGKSFSANIFVAVNTGNKVANRDSETFKPTLPTCDASNNSLYCMIKNNANTTTQINFAQTSAASNTNGIYTTTSTDSGNPVYYYRGNVDNHLKFANYCWRIVRTTETGGVKLVYDGVPKEIYESAIIEESSYTNVTNDATYPYTFDTTNKTWTSNNHTHSTTSTITFSVATAGDYIFNYTVSSESCCDKVRLYKNGTKLTEDGGSKTSTVVLSGLTTTDVIKVDYKKDGSVSTGNDNVVFSLGVRVGDTIIACDNTGAATTIGNSSFNNSSNSPAYVGYMYGKTYPYKSKSVSSLSGSIIFGNDITYSNGTYTLTDTYTVSDISNWSSEYSTVASRYHYTCFINGTSCTTVNYSYHMGSSTIYYFELTGGKTHLDILNEMLDNSSNTTNSTIKTTIDNWYQTNLSSYTSQLEDTVFCNDRSYNVAGSGWDKDSSSSSNYYLYFNAYRRLNTNKTPTLQCSSNNDKFTVNESNGNGDLIYPIGLLSADEVALAGGVWATSNSSYYLYNNLSTWAGSPYYFSSSVAAGFYVYSVGYLLNDYVYASYGVRGAVSLKPGIAVSGGTGTATDPYIVE